MEKKNHTHTNPLMVLDTSPFCLKFNELVNDLEEQFQTMCRSSQWNCSEFSIPPRPYTNSTDPVPMCSWTVQSSCEIVSGIYENMVRLDAYANTWWTNFFSVSGHPLPALIVWNPLPADMRQCTEETAQIYLAHAEEYLEQKANEKPRLMKQLQASKKPRHNLIPLVGVFVLVVLGIVIGCFSRPLSRYFFPQPHDPPAAVQYEIVPHLGSPIETVHQGEPVLAGEGGGGAGPRAF